MVTPSWQHIRTSSDFDGGAMSAQFDTRHLKAAGRLCFLRLQWVAFWSAEMLALLDSLRWCGWMDAW